MCHDCYEPTRIYIFARLNAIQKKYGEKLLYERFRDFVRQDLLNLYHDMKIFWGAKLARRLFKECLIVYRGPDCGAAVFRDLLGGA